MLLAKVLSLILAIGIAAALVLNALGDLTVGRPQVIDAGTLKLKETTLRLYAIRAPKVDQHCRWLDRQWACGAAAYKALQEKIGTRVVRCLPKGHSPSQIVLAVCYVGTEDLNRWLVEQGWAQANPDYSDRYIGVQKEALNALRGLWSSQFTLPRE